MEQEQFRVGSALEKGFQIWFRNLPAFLVLAILVYSPIVVYTAVITRGPLLGKTETLATYQTVTTLLQIPLSLIATAAVFYGTIQQLRGRPAGLVRSIVFGLRRLLPVLGVGLVNAALYGIGLGISRLPGGEYLILPVLVPALVLTCMLYVAVPVAVVERPGLVGALRRSRHLTNGYKLPIFTIIILLGFLFMFALFAVGGLFDDESMTDHDLKLSLWLGLGLDVAFGALSAVVNSVVYRDLRAAKEKVGNEEIARVFD